MDFEKCQKAVRINQAYADERAERKEEKIGQKIRAVARDRETDTRIDRETDIDRGDTEWQRDKENREIRVTVIWDVREDRTRAGSDCSCNVFKHKKEHVWVSRKHNVDIEINMHYLKLHTYI